MFSWPDSRDFDRVTKSLVAGGFLQPGAAGGVDILASAAFDDLLFAFFSAWALRALGRQHYEIRFVILNEDHSGLVTRRSSHPSVYPAITVRPAYNDSFLSASSLTGLRGKLLYNAEISPRRADLPLRKLQSFRTPGALRRFVVEQTILDPDLFGWLWGGQLIPIAAPASLMKDLMGGEEGDVRWRFRGRVG